VPTVELVALAEAVANAEGVPIDIFKGLIERESAWKIDARSGAGALGLCQVMPWWITTEAGRNLTGLTSMADYLNPALNMRAGARILADEIRRFGSVPLAIMAYNAGSPSVQKAVSSTGSKDPLIVEKSLSSETRAYWRAVLNWAAAWAGQISRAEALIKVKTGEITSEIMSFATSQTGKFTGFFLVMAVLAAALVAGGRRAG
jgi:soluble lytic murein transglycosylase-like protein